MLQQRVRTVWLSNSVFSLLNVLLEVSDEEHHNIRECVVKFFFNEKIGFVVQSCSVAHIFVDYLQLLFALFDHNLKVFWYLLYETYL